MSLHVHVVLESVGESPHEDPVCPSVTCLAGLRDDRKATSNKAYWSKVNKSITAFLKLVLDSLWHDFASSCDEYGTTPSTCFVLHSATKSPQMWLHPC